MRDTSYEIIFTASSVKWNRPFYLSNRSNSDRARLIFLFYFFQEWSYNSPHRFVGSYKFESCMKWSPVDENSASSAILCWIRNDEEENFTLADASANLGI